MSFKDVKCQDKAIESFQRALRLGRLSHAYIFAGPEGVGKFTMARECAKTLICQNQQHYDRDGETWVDSCGECESCKLFEGDGHPDFKHIYKELVQFVSKPEYRKRIPIDMPKIVIQEFLIDQIANKPTHGNKTIYILDEAEKLNTASQNALLKTLEEPPGYCIIILLCTRLDKLLPTILSRCQVVWFGPVSEEIVVEKLVLKGVDEAQARYWARYTEGSLGQSLRFSTMGAEENRCYAIKKEVLSRLGKLTLYNSLEFAEWLCHQSKEISQNWSEDMENVSKSDISRRAQKALIRMVMSAFSDSIKNQLGQTDNLINADQLNEISRISETYDVEKCSELIQKTYASLNWVDSSVNERLIFEEMLLKFADSARM